MAARRRRSSAQRGRSRSAIARRANQTIARDAALRLGETTPRASTAAGRAAQDRLAETLLRGGSGQKSRRGGGGRGAGASGRSRSRSAQRGAARGRR